MKLEEVFAAYRAGKTIVWNGHNKYNGNAKLHSALDVQLCGDLWEIEKEKVKKYPVLMQKIGPSWATSRVGDYFLTLEHFYTVEEAKETYSDRDDLKVIRLITGIPELIQEEEI